MHLIEIPIYGEGYYISDFVTKTMVDVIRKTAGRFLDQMALVVPEFNIRLNYSQLYDQCRKTARGLLALLVNRKNQIQIL